MYQQGNFTLTAGVKDYNVTFSTQFPTSSPSLILTDVFNSNGEDPQDFLDGSVVGRTTNGFSFSLVTAPDNNNYVLSWMASDGLGTTLATSSGLPVTDLPVFTGNSIPENAIFPAVVSNGVNKSVAVRWDKMKTLIAASHQHNAEDLANGGSTGIALIKANNSSEARAVIEAATLGHQHVLTDLIGSTSTGRSLIAAADAATARSVISAANATHTHTATQIGASTLGVSLITATTQEAARSLLGVDATGSATVIPDNITGATTIGKSLLTATSEANARTTITAANRVGWESDRTLLSSRTLDPLDFGCKFVVANTLIYTIPTGVNNLGKIGFYVGVEGSLSIQANVGVTIKDSKGVDIISLSNLPVGFYILENVGLNTFTLSGYDTAFQRDLAMAQNKAEFIDALNLTLADLEATGGGDAPLYNGGTGIYALTSITSENLGSFFTGNPAGIFFYTTRSTVSINTIGTLEDTQSFIIRNSGSSNLIITPTGDVKINDTTSAVSIPPKSWMQFTRFGVDNLTCHYAIIPDSTDSFTAYVGIHGNNSSGVLGDITKPFATVAGALTALGNKTKKTVIVLPGNYTETKIKCTISTDGNITNINFNPGAYVEITSGTSLFTHSAGSLFINGGNFTMSGSCGRFANLSSNSLTEFNAKIETIKVLASTVIPILETSDLVDPGKRKHLFAADTIECPQTLLLKADSGAVQVQVRNLITGSSALHIIDCNVDFKILGGEYYCADKILHSDSSNYELNLYLENCSITQGISGYPVTSPILKQPLNAGTFRINGVNGKIIGAYTSPSTTRVQLTDTQAGTLIITNVILVGSIVISTGDIILNSVFIQVPSSASGASIDADTPGNSIVIYGTCVTNKAYNTANISYSGGSILFDTNFII